MLKSNLSLPNLALCLIVLNYPLCCRTLRLRYSNRRYAEALAPRNQLVTQVCSQINSLSYLFSKFYFAELSTILFYSFVQCFSIFCSLACDSPLDARVKSALLADTLTLVGLPAMPTCNQLSAQNNSLKMRIGAVST